MRAGGRGAPLSAGATLALVDEGGTWGIPGGAIRDGESSQTAALREVTEEIGEPPGFAVRAVQVQDCGGDWQFEMITADVDDRFEAYCLRETDATGWFTVDEMRALPLRPWDAPLA